MELVVAFLKPLSPLCLGGKVKPKREVFSANNLDLSIYPQARQSSLSSVTSVTSTVDCACKNRQQVHKSMFGKTPPLSSGGRYCSPTSARTSPRSPPQREREATGTSSSGQTTYDVICRVGLIQTDSSCI